MPVNDFTEYMGQPPQTQWGSPSGSRPQYWGGSAPQRQEQPSWAGVGGRYGGNAGGMLGGLADMYAPMSNYGIWAAQVGPMQNQILAGQHSYNTGTADLLLKNSAESAQGRIESILRAQGVEGSRNQITGVAKLLSKSTEVRAQLGGGDLTEVGARALTGALAGQHNGYKPSQREVTELHRSFEGYYGFDGTGTVDYAKTMGRSQDELAVITSEVRQRMSPEKLRRHEAAARREFNQLLGEDVGNELAKSGVSKAAWDAELSAGGTNEDKAERLAKGSGKTKQEMLKIIDAAGGAAWKARGLTGVVSQEGMLQNKLMGENQGAAKMLTAFEDAGFTGDLKELFSNLEQQFGDEAFSTAKMEALAARIQGISRSTGMAFDSIESLINVAQKGASGIDLGATQASGAVAAGMMFGNERGFTSAQRLAIQSDAVAAFAEPSKSPAAVAAGLLQMSGDPRYAEYQRLQGEGAPESRAKAKALLDDATITNLPKGVEGAMRALQLGDVETANMQRQDLLERGREDANEYNALLKSGADPARLAALKTSLGGRGADFSKDGRASLSDRTFANRDAAAGEAWDTMNDSMQDNILSLGASVLQDGATTEEKRIAGASLLANSQQLKSGRAGWSAASASLTKQGLKVRGDVDVSKLSGLYGTLADARVLGEYGHSMFNIMGNAGLSDEEFQQQEERQQRAARVQSIGGVSDLFKRGLAGEGGAKALQGLVGGSGLDPLVSSMLGSILGADEKDREGMLKSLTTVSTTSATLATLDAANPANAEEIKKLEAERTAAYGGLKNFDKDTMTAFQSAADSGQLKDMIAKAHTAGIGAEFIKMKGTITVQLLDADGKEKNVKPDSPTTIQTEPGQGSASNGGKT